MAAKAFIYAEKLCWLAGSFLCLYRARIYQIYFLAKKLFFSSPLFLVVSYAFLREAVECEKMAFWFFMERVLFFIEFYLWHQLVVFDQF